MLSLLLAAGLAAQPDHKMTKADVDKWMTDLSNWGRWGAEDQLGTLNLITPKKRKAAIALVKEGFPVSLAHNVDTERAEDNTSPLVHTVTARAGNFSLDTYTFNYHGYNHTHMDALCHAFYQGKMFNGFSQNEVTAKGAAKDSILSAKSGIMTRGILMDIPRLKGVEYLEPGTAIFPEDLDAWEKMAGVKVGEGDVIFIRTGRWARRAAKGPWPVGRNSAGLHASCAKWLHDRGVAMLGSDVASDVVPSQVDGVFLPIHQMVLVAIGIHIFDDCDLEPLAQAAAARKRWSFLLTAAPIAIPGGTGSPLNPIATF
jgi:kynurenine formamidase